MGRRKKYATQREAEEANRNKTAKRERDKNASVKEISPLPKVVNPERKERCRFNFGEFLQTYGADEAAGEGFTFIDPFCDEQLYMIHVLEDVLLHGGEIPLCIFRGGVKTTLCEWGMFWATAYGHQKFCLVAAASVEFSRKIIRNIKRMIEENLLLQEDFPEICYPVQCLERVNQRAKSQMLDGEPTNMEYSADSIQFANIRGADSSKHIICGVGADSSFRGYRVGKQRPTAILIDDPQTTRSARSDRQCAQRWDNIATSMKGLAGPGVSLAMVATITVIRKGDLAEKILEKWGGKRFGILRSMPKNMNAWDEYDDLYQRTKREVETSVELANIVNAYYLANREKLDEGAEAAWETNFTDSEVSAIQHAMHLYYFDRRAFWSEYMNQPVDEDRDAANLTREALEAKIRQNVKRGVVPLEYDTVTAGIDIQKTCLYWCVTAWSGNFDGHVLDYGRFPKGQKKLQTLYPVESFEGCVSMGLTELTDILTGTEFTGESGERYHIEKILVDANWGITTKIVKKVCGSFRRGLLEPTFGWGKAPNQRFFGHGKKLGEDRGEEWRKPPMERKGICRTVTYHTDYWKTFVRNRIQAGLAASSTLTFYAGDGYTHQKFFEHLLGETSSKLTGTYGTIDKWVLIPGCPNHWWDCLVMSAVAASMKKIQLPQSRRVTSSTNRTVITLPGQTTVSHSPEEIHKSRNFIDLSAYQK